MLQVLPPSVLPRRAAPIPALPVAVHADALAHDTDVTELTCGANAGRVHELPPSVVTASPFARPATQNEALGHESELAP
jgi:hypothetical protein